MESVIADDALMARKLFAAADLFQILGIAFDYPTNDLATGFSEGTLPKDVSACLREMGCGIEPEELDLASLGEAPRDVLARMRREHSRLFANPAHPIIWTCETMFCHEDDGSEKRPDLFVSPVCLHVEQMMREAGVKVSDSNKQPADYLPTELQFLSCLCNIAARECLSGGCVADIERLYAFKRNHLDRWAMSFFGCVVSETRIDEYRMVAAAARLGLKSLEGFLEDLSLNQLRDTMARG